MTPAARRWAFLIAGAGMVAFYVWGLTGLPGFGRYPGPYGFILNDVAVGQTKAGLFQVKGIGVGILLIHADADVERSVCGQARVAHRRRDLVE